MSVVVDVTIRTESFTLQNALSAEPDITVEAERIASHSTEEVLPFLWASGGDVDAFQQAMEEDPTVTNVAAIEEGEGSALFLLEWHEEFTELITEMIDQHANILEARAKEDSWQLRLRFAEEGQVSGFREYFDERGHTFEVQKLFHPSTSRQREFGLTPEQYETLVTALREGYFTVPRTISIEELANELGISSNATSQRLRRATGNLVRNTLTIGTFEQSSSEYRER